ncbi:MAG: hypothetical protein MH137_07645, partial [Flavobacteriales bacterium]|nr:hypothetical protein [Flavobacteriales bacterium]
NIGSRWLSGEPMTSENKKLRKKCPEFRVENIGSRWLSGEPMTSENKKNSGRKARSLGWRISESNR